MNVIKFRPFREMEALHNRVNRLFGDACYGDNECQSTSMATWYPPTDIFETENDYVFKLQVPGMSKDDIKVEVKENTLTIGGERKEDTEVKRENYHRVESYSGAFSRSFVLPKNVDSSNVEAQLKNGVLELRVSKPEEVKPRAITIGVN